MKLPLSLEINRFVGHSFFISRGFRRYVLFASIFVITDALLYFDSLNWFKLLRGCSCFKLSPAVSQGTCDL